MEDGHPSLEAVNAFKEPAGVTAFTGNGSQPLATSCPMSSVETQNKECVAYAESKVLPDDPCQQEEDNDCPNSKAVAECHEKTVAECHEKTVAECHEKTVAEFDEKAVLEGHEKTVPEGHEKTVPGSHEKTVPERSHDSSSNEAGAGEMKPPAAPLLSYTAPPWASEPALARYSLEVLKTGVMLDPVDLDKRNNATFIVFGRLPTCDVFLEHPSISRYHAVLQYGKDTMQPEKGFGWHLFDLGSTHGSRLNQQAVPSKQYVRVHVGHVLKFGGSTRLFVLQGPEEDMERESSRTVSEIKRDAEQRKLKAKGIIDDNVVDNESDSITSTTADQDRKGASSRAAGITWGMDYRDDGEGGSDGSDGSGGEDMDFESFEKRAEYYKSDPKAALTKFFDREGYDLVYECEQRGSGFQNKWHCRIELPVETSGRSVVAEVEVSGGKKEAQVQCALRACEILDKQGMLRKAGNKAKKRKQKGLQDNDFYDSDEDTFYDRTGELEQKRLRRKQRLEEAVGNNASSRSDTYDTLLKKSEDAKREMSELQRQLDHLKQCNVTSDAASSATDIDPLDDFMAAVRKTESAGGTQEVKAKKSQLSQQLVKLKHEAERLDMLLKIATPVALPQFKPSTSGTAAEGAAGRPPAKSAVLIGSMKGFRLRRKLAPVDADGACSTETGEQTQSAVVDAYQKGLKDDEIVETEEVERKEEEPSVNGTGGGGPDLAKVIIPAEENVSSQPISQRQKEELQLTASSPPSNRPRGDTTASSGPIQPRITTDESLEEAKEVENEKCYSVTLPPPLESGEEGESSGDKDKLNGNNDLNNSCKQTAGHNIEQGPAEEVDMSDEEEESVSKEEGDKMSANIAKSRRHRVRPNRKRPGNVRGSEYEATADPDYAMWLPPDNQAGDGKTSLNEKFAGRY